MERYWIRKERYVKQGINVCDITNKRGFNLAMKGRKIKGRSKVNQEDETLMRHNDISDKYARGDITT